jgi:hypothetical protein
MLRRASIALFILVVAGLAMSLEAYRFKKIDKTGPADIAPVAADIPIDVTAVSSAIQQTFNNWSDLERTGFSGTYRNRFPKGDKWNRFYLFRHGATVFPSDDEILLDRGADQFVPRYVQIPPDRRQADFYLREPSGDEYWTSEYLYQGKPTKFRCSFLVHVETAAGGSATRVEIFEYQPEIWVGEKFAMSAHAILPGMLHDIRFAGPTTADRVEVLHMIQAAAH